MTSQAIDHAEPPSVARAHEPGALRLSGITKWYGKGSKQVRAVDDLDLALEPGELVALLGPSGCGKTTTLRCVGGLEEPDAGVVQLAGRVVSDAAAGHYVPPERRGIGMVFQSYSLWPHMTVRRNLEYPLRARRLKDGLRDGWVEQAAELVECAEFLERYPSELSGGQQQRIALARGIVARPDLMLFDEPLSNLDSRLRVDLRTEIRRLHEHLGFGGLYVTHDQEEAIVVGDRTVVMRDGRIEQQGKPKEVFERPINPWVAEFLGATNGRRHGSTELRARPEDCVVMPIGRAGAEVVVESAIVVGVIYSGNYTEVVLDVGGTPWKARGGTDGYAPDAGPRRGEACSVRCTASRVYAFAVG